MASPSGRGLLRGTLAAAAVLIAGAWVDHALLVDAFAAAARRAGHELGAAEGGGVVAVAGRVVLALALATLAWFAGLSQRRAPWRVATIAGVAWLLAYPTLMGQLVLFGVLPGRVAAGAAAFGLVEFGAAVAAAAWAMAPRRPMA